MVLILTGASYGLFREPIREVVDPNWGYDLTDFRHSEGEIVRERDHDDRIWRMIYGVSVTAPRPDPTPIEEVIVPTPTSPPPYNGEGNVIQVWLTYYTCPPFCGTMKNGEIVYEGAVACGGYFQRGQKIKIEGDPTFRTYVCADIGYGGWYWVDIFFDDANAGRDFIRTVGNYVNVELID